MVNKEIVLKKIDVLDKNLQELDKFRGLSIDDLEDLKNRWAVERGLQASIEIILDVGNHIIADERLGSPEKNQDIIDILGKQGVISEQLANDLAGLAGFRNILVHEYTNIDLEKVYEHLQKAHHIFSAFITEILKYLE